MHWYVTGMFNVSILSSNGILPKHTSASSKMNRLFMQWNDIPVVKILKPVVRYHIDKRNMIKTDKSDPHRLRISAYVVKQWNKQTNDQNSQDSGHLGKARVLNKGEIWWVTLLGPPTRVLLPSVVLLEPKDKTKQGKLCSLMKEWRGWAALPSWRWRGCYIRFSAVGRGEGGDFPRTTTEACLGFQITVLGTETLQTICCCHHLKEWCHTRSFCKCPLEAGCLHYQLCSVKCWVQGLRPQWALRS